MSELQDVQPDYVGVIDDGTGDVVKVGVIPGWVCIEVHNEAAGDYFGVLLTGAEALQLGVLTAIAAKSAEVRA